MQDEFILKTGKTLEEWRNIISASGLQKHLEIVNFLKSDHGITYGFANMITHKARGTDAGSVEDQSQLIDDQYKGKENLFPIYEKLMEVICGFGDDIEEAPKKAYVSIRRKKQFAIIQPSVKTRLDLGLNIKGEEPSGITEKAGSWNSMCTHRIKIGDISELNQEVFDWIKKAYDQAG